MTTKLDRSRRITVRSSARKGGIMSCVLCGQGNTKPGKQCRECRDERYTPVEIWDRVAATLGGIDFDPCPVRGAINGLELDWSWRGTIFVNPPGTQFLAFARQFAAEVDRGAFLLYNWDHSTEAFRVIAARNPVWVLLHKRHKFKGPDGRLYEVGRSQGVAFVGVSYSDVIENWYDLGTAMLPPTYARSYQ